MRRTALLLLAFILILPSAAALHDALNTPETHIGVMTGSTGELFSMEAWPDATLEGFAGIMDAIAALDAGKLNAVVTSDINAVQVVAGNPALMIDGERLNEEHIPILLRRNEPELRAALNAVLRTLQADGTLDDMERRWIGTLTPEYVEIPEADGPVLRVGLTGNRAPFSYPGEDGRFIGFGPELARRVGQMLGYRIEFVATDFAAMIPALQSGKTDVIIDLMVATEERAKQVDFTDTYHTTGQVLLIKNPDYIPEEVGFFAGLKADFENNFLRGNRWRMILSGVMTTLIISVCAFLLATALGFALYFCGACRFAILRRLVRVYLSILRGTPMVVLLLISFYVLFAKSGLSAVAVAIIAFGLNSAASVSVILRSAIGTVDGGQIEAARSMGFSGAATFLYVTLPQAVRVAFPMYLSEFISLIKGTAVVGYIAIVDLTKAADFIRGQTFSAYFPLLMVAVIYILLIGAVVWLLGRVFERATAPNRRRSRT